MKTTLTASLVVLGMMAGSASAQQYEFKILKTEGVPSEDALNEAGADGWQIRQIVTAPSDDSLTEREYQVFMQRTIQTRRVCNYYAPDGTFECKTVPSETPELIWNCLYEGPNGEQGVQGGYQFRPDESDPAPNGWKLITCNTQ
ncbi:hypothetical protein ACTU44_21735 (plasmid) [Thalassospira sp. SM2505]